MSQFGKIAYLTVNFGYEAAIGFTFDFLTLG